MAKDTSIRVPLTQSIVNGLNFEQPLVGINDAGKAVLGPNGIGDRRDWTVRDTTTPGFSVRVHRTKTVYQVQRKMGMRVDEVEARPSAPIRRVIGDTRTMKLDEARRTAQLWLGQMAKGLDPHSQLRREALAEAAQERKERLTFGDYYDRHLKDESGISPATVKDREKVRAWMSKAPIWKHPIHDLDLEVVRTSLQPLFEAAQGKRQAPKWGPKSNGLASAWKIYRHMSAAYSSFIGSLGFEIERNKGPFAQAKKKGKWPAVQAKDTFLDLDRDDHLKWLKALVAMRDHAEPARQVMADFLLATLILGGRKREVQLLEWKHLDFDERRGVLPADNRKVRADHWFPITPWLAEILEQRRERNKAWGRDGDWVFPSEHHGKPLHTYTGILEDLKEQTGVWLTAHDMRRTAATTAMEITGSEMFVSLTLGHTKAQKDVSMNYVRGRLKLLRPVFEQRERQLREALGLEVIGQQASPIDAAIEFLLEAKKDPAQRLDMERKVGGILTLLK